MNNVEELFKNLAGSEYLAYLEYVEETSRQVTSQTYGEIVGVIKEIEGGSPLSLYLLKGRILEEEPDQYVTAEIGSYETDKILYVYFNRIDDEKNFSILAKITATELDRYDQIFTQRNCDSMERPSSSDRPTTTVATSSEFRMLRPNGCSPNTRR